MNKIFSPINAALLIAITIVFLYGVSTVPGDQLVPVHWNLAGEPDFWFAAEWAMWIGPAEVIVVVISVLFMRAKLSPEELEAGQHVTNAGISIALAAGLFMQSVIVFSANDVLFNVPQLATIFVGLVMLIVGNYLPKSQINRVAGIRLPWTMTSEAVWARTHHFAGKAFMLAGAIILVVGAFNLGGQWLLVGTLGVVAIALLTTIFYSYSVREQV